LPRASAARINISERGGTALNECFEAFILQTRQEHEPAPHLTFLIDFNCDRKQLFPAVAKAIQPHMKAGTNFELLKATFAILQIARGAAAPVYTAN
jgi:hypothetical protein